MDEEKQNPTWKRIHEDFALELVEYPNLICKDCKHKEPDLIIDGKIIVTGYDKVCCEVYPMEDGGDIKPEEVFEKNKCEHYEKDGE